MTFFDPKKVDFDYQPGDFEPLPDGEYIVEVEKITPKPTKNGDGSGVNLQYNIVSGEYSGRKVFEWITLQHKKIAAQKMGEKQFGLLLKAAIGENVALQSPSDLLNKKLVVQIELEVGEGGRENTRIVEYKPFSGQGVETPKSEDSFNWDSTDIDDDEIQF